MIMLKPLKTKLGLNAKTTFVVGAFMSLSLAFMGGFIYFEGVRLAEKQALSLLLEQQEDYLDEIHNGLNNSKAHLLTFSATPPIKALIRANEQGGVDPLSGDSLAVWRHRLSQIMSAFFVNFPNYRSVSLLNNKGQVLFSDHGLEGKIKNRSKQFTYQEPLYKDIQPALKRPNKSVYYSDIQHGDHHEEPILAISTPIYMNGEVKGVVLTEISAIPMLNSAIVKRKGIETYIADNKGKIWVKPNKAGGLDAYLQTKKFQKNNYILINEKRNSVLAIHKVIFDKSEPHRYWRVIHELPKEVVFNEVNKARDSMLVVGLFISLIAVLAASALVSRKITKPIIKLVQASRSVSMGDYSAYLDERSVNDEFKELYQTFNAYTKRSIEELKALEQQIDSSEQYVETIVTNLVDALVVIDEFGTIESCNPATSRLFGYKEHEMLGNNINMLIPEPVRTQHDSYLLNYMTTGEKKIIGKGRDVAAQRKNGSIFPIELSVSEYTVNGKPCFIGSLRDISDRKMMEQEIQQTGERLTRQYNSYLSLSAFVRKASISFEEVCNKILKECAEIIEVDLVGLWLFNNSRDEFLCQNYYNFETKSCLKLSPLLVADHSNYFRELIVEKGVLDNESSPLLTSYAKQANRFISVLQLPIRKYKSVAGVFHLVNREKSRVLTADEIQYVKSLSMLMEILLEEESRRLVRQQLKEKNKELELASQLKSQFLANMSHELRTPLNAIIGFSELLKDGVLGPLTDEQGQYSTEIFDSGSHLLDLINGILDLSKIEAGKEQLELAEVSISSLLETSLYVVRDKAKERHISITEKLDKEIADCWLDERKIKQILINLLSNAVKFTPNDGSVILSTRLHKLVNSEPSSANNELIYREGGYLEISVADTGIGISEENIEKLFRPFEQIDGTLSREFGGTGLGLSLVKAMVELHGGFVKVHSKLGEGSTFTIYVPYQKVETEIETELLALIVDDDLNAIELTNKQLDSFNYNSVSVKSAEEALDWLGKNAQPDLIILDELLPGMQGTELITLLQTKFVEYKNIPIILISIKGSDVAQQCYQKGAYLVMDKPINPKELKEAVMELAATTNR